MMSCMKQTLHCLQTPRNVEKARESCVHLFYKHYITQSRAWIIIDFNLELRKFESDPA